jgi:hypothetical protein
MNPDTPTPHELTRVVQGIPDDILAGTLTCVQALRHELQIRSTEGGFVARGSVCNLCRASP